MMATLAFNELKSKITPEVNNSFEYLYATQDLGYPLYFIRKFWCLIMASTKSMYCVNF